MSSDAFHDVRFPLAIAFGAVGGPERRTDIIQLASGAEHRNSPWAGSRRRWDVGGAVQTLDELNAVVAFFEARCGPLHGFRFRDFVDDRSCSPEQEISATDQAIGAGDGSRAAFQLVKHYGGKIRTINKPVEGTVRIAVDGIETSDGFSVDHLTGLVTFDSAPQSGAAITAGFQFDCAARFDSERIEASLEGFGAGRLINIKLVELLEG